MSKVITFDNLEMQSKNSKKVNILPYSIEKNKEHLLSRWASSQENTVFIKVIINFNLLTLILLDIYT